MSVLPIYVAMLAQVDNWGNLFLGVDRDDRFPLLCVAIGCLVGIIAIIGGVVNSMHRRNLAAAIKRDMIERGMSAEEIVRVIEAAAPPEDAAQLWIATSGRKKNT
jgi:hypothetical protein